MKTVAPWYSGYHFTQLYSTKPELRFCVGSNPARGVSEIRVGEDLGLWPWLEISLNAFVWLTIPQKQFIIIFNHDMVFLLSGILLANG